MKKICFVLILSLLMAMSMAAAAYAEPAEITDGSDLRHLIEGGGEGILIRNITASDLSTLRVMEGRAATIDMNGHSISMTCSDMMDLRGNVVLYNGDRVNIYFRNGPGNEGRLALKDIRKVTVRAQDYARTKILMLNVGENQIENIAETPVVVTDSKKAMTDEQFVEMVRTGTLPQLESEGYLFTEWKDQSGNAITEWKTEGVTEITAHWDKDLKITFDADGGTCDVESARPLDSGKLKSIPAAKKDGVCFDGWMTEAGERVTKDTVFKEAMTVKATWVEESERTDALVKFLDEQGFSKSSIDRHVGLLSRASTASTFGQGNIWFIISGLLLIACVVLGLMLLRKNRR